MNLTGVYRTMRLSWESDNEDQEIHITARPQPLQKILEVRINSKSAFNFIAQCKNYVSSRTSCWTVNIGISMLWYLMQLEWGVNILSRCEERKGGYALFYNHIPSYNIFVTMVPNSTDGVDSLSIAPTRSVKLIDQSQLDISANHFSSWEGPHPPTNTTSFGSTVRLSPTGELKSLLVKLARRKVWAYREREDIRSWCQYLVTRWARVRNGGKLIKRIFSRTSSVGSWCSVSSIRHPNTIHPCSQTHHLSQNA